jgi:hypothetical protein
MGSGPGLRPFLLIALLACDCGSHRMLKQGLPENLMEIIAPEGNLMDIIAMW